jgi:hypothetical protein
MTTLRIGFEVKSGAPVDVPIQHIAVYGLTRQAGKTTALEGMVDRYARASLSALFGCQRALVFRTGKNEIPFAQAGRIRPFFRERHDWRFVERLLWSFLDEKSKVYRTWLMRTTQGATSLADVHARIVKAGKGARRGWDEDLLYQLDHYFAELLPGLAALDLSTELDLDEGVSVMDLEGVSKAVQSTIVAAVLDYLMAHPPTDGCVVVLPEARNFIPSDGKTPASKSLDDFVREGAKLGLYLWLDSQSLTGVDQQVVRNVGLSLHGRQTSDIEIRRIAKAVGHGVVAKDVKGLGLGQFLLEDRDGVRKVYVQPAWLPEGTAVAIAKGKVTAESVRPPVTGKQSWGPVKENKNVDAKKEQEYRKTIDALVEEVSTLKAELSEANRRAEANARLATHNAEAGVASALEAHKAGVPYSSMPAPVFPEDGGPTDLDDAALRDMGKRERTKADVHVFTETPQMTVHVREVRIEATGEENNGRAALLVADGYFDDRKSVNETMREFKERGWGIFSGGSGWNNMDRLLKKLAEQGFLRNVDKGYVVVPEAKRRIRLAKEA